MSKVQVWKLQRPLMTNGDMNELLAYTEDRKRNALITVDEQTIDELFGDELRVYVRGKVKRGNLVIHEVLGGSHE